MPPAAGASSKKPTRISMSCLAEFVTKPGLSVEKRLRPYKFNKRGEGFARSSYYRQALAAIRAYHSSGNEPGTLERALAEMKAAALISAKGWEQSKLEHNINAILAYRKIYSNRRFRIHTNHRLAYQTSGIIVTAQPDLWVDEDGMQVLLKIGMARHSTRYIDMLLCLLRKCAIGSGYKIRAKNIVYLNISTGREMICSESLVRFNREFADGARQIAKAWPELTDANANTDPQVQ